MKFRFSHKFLTRFLAIHMMMFVLSASFPLGALADTIVTVDIKANGSDGPITITDGDSYTYNWTSSNATSCQLTSPVNSGIPLSGFDIVLPGSPFYPAIGAPMILTVVCTDGLTTGTDAVIINLASLPPPPPRAAPASPEWNQNGWRSVQSSSSSRQCRDSIWPGRTPGSAR